ncbi:MAG: alpha/beta hydrolase [Lachnospiraceae bacterium]|nr:alpha/beta hydrolase [Lachnospiraceae bacterium]
MFIQLDGQVLFYEKSGEGKPVIMLHGNGEDHHIFDSLSAALTDEYEIYALDSRGHGGSSTAKEYHYSDMAGDVINFIEALHLDHPYILGFSDGAIVALMVAMARGDLINGIISCGANLSPKGLTFGARSDIKKMYKLDPNPIIKMMMDEPNINESDLRNIQVPAIIMAGSKDMIKDKETKRIAANISNSKLIIMEGHDHSSYIVNSDLLTDTIREFCI